MTLVASPTTPVERFRATIWSALERANRLPVAEHARLAHHAGGPSITELESRIVAARAGAVEAVAS